MCAAEDPSKLAIAGVLVLLWMGFCVTARRLQDMNYPGLLSFPLFVMAALVFIYEFDPALIGEDDGTLELLMLFRRIASIGLLLVVGCGGMGGESHPGPNAYGEPFGTRAAKKSAKPRDDAEAAPAPRIMRRVAQPQSYTNNYAGEGAGVVRPRVTAAAAAKPRGFGRR